MKLYLKKGHLLSFLLPNPSSDHWPLIFRQRANHEEPHLALNRLTGESLFATKLLLPQHRLLEIGSERYLRTSQEMRWVLRSEWSKAEHLCDLVEKTPNEFQEIETKTKPNHAQPPNQTNQPSPKHKHENQTKPKHRILKISMGISIGTSRTQHQYCILSSTALSMSRKKSILIGQVYS